jgi:hypothetical protein
MTSTNRLTCRPIMWSHQGPELSFAEQHAFRYEVRDERGDVTGFINADRARSHPDVHWIGELLRDGKIVKLAGVYRTVEEAIAAF